jgi:peptidoglycan/xylan/chitin deacetylase (PgdA/CDA1 family)
MELQIFAAFPLASARGGIPVVNRQMRAYSPKGRLQSGSRKLDSRANFPATRRPAGFQRYCLVWKGFAVKKKCILLVAMVFVLLALLSTHAAISAKEAAAYENDAPKYIALTFDDGPNAVYTGTLLEGLKSRGVHATFFLIGKLIEGNEALVLQMKADGHQIGNHTWSHLDLRNASTCVANNELCRTDAALTSLLGPDTYWIRPPFGFITKAQQPCLAVPVVKWSLDSLDWKMQNTSQDAARILKNVKSGDIILMHDIFKQSVEAALQVVDTLQAEGYTFVTVKDLLELNGICPQAGAIYCSAAGN